MGVKHSHCWHQTALHCTQKSKIIPNARRMCPRQAGRLQRDLVRERRKQRHRPVRALGERLQLAWATQQDRSLSAAFVL